MNAIVRRVENPWLDRWIKAERSRLDVVMHPRRGGMRPVVRALRRGEAMAALLDQNQRKRGLFAPFFGRLAATDRSIAAVTSRLGIPLHVGATVRVGHGFRFRLTEFTTLRADDRVDRAVAIERLVRQINQVFEKLILAQPDQYLWMHNRYRTRPPNELANTSTVATEAGRA
jgi:KDO2-lipid IV(A) lauroyltransferase